MTFCAGLAAGGKKPYAAVYSTFLQRAYDQILEDVCLQDLPVVFGLDRSGIVGADGETHHGIFDLSYLRSMPNLVMLAPATAAQLEEMMDYSLNCPHPCAIRYPRGEALREPELPPFEPGHSQRVKDGNDADIWAVGPMLSHAIQAADLLEKEGIAVGVVNMASLKPLDKEMILEAASDYPLIVTLEDNVISGGEGEALTACLARKGHDCAHVVNLGWPDSFIPHGTQTGLYEKYGLDAASIAGRIREELSLQNRKEPQQP